MILPTKTIEPVDSLISISATIIEIIGSHGLSLDDLKDEFNKNYYKKVSIEKLILAIDFLYIIGRIEEKNEIIKISK